MFTRSIVFAMTCGALTFGCAGEPADSSDDTQEIIDNLVQAGYPRTDIMVVDGLVYAGRDAVVTLEASREMIASPEAGHEQYRTNNLVGNGVVNICVNGATFTNATLSNGLNMAIQNYNQLGLRWHLTRTTGSTSGCNAVINARLVGGTGGSSGFPSGGAPFGTINIGSGNTQFGVNTVEHIITHEIGHTIGFRHSDFFNRSISCGGAATNEGNGGVGAILTAGTPSGASVGGSIMNSCFRASENGEFTGSDINALNTLY
jgi:Dual-action HEIGH metallo-peptidase